MIDDDLSSLEMSSRRPGPLYRQSLELYLRRVDTQIFVECSNTYLALPGVYMSRPWRYIDNNKESLLCLTMWVNHALSIIFL